MILVGTGLFFLAYLSIHALGLALNVEETLTGFSAIAAVIAAGYFGKAALCAIENRHAR